MKGESRMAHSSSIPQFTLDLLGVFRLLAPNGERIEIASKKGVALIATLAMANDGERTRGWLHDKLWGKREQAQARSSLRRELSNLRKCLNTGAVRLLICEHDRVKLDLRYLRVDARALDAGEEFSAGRASVNPGEFLEGLDIAGEDGFENWLREQRGKFVDLGTGSHKDTARPVHGLVAHGVETRPIRVLTIERPRAGICVLPFANISGDPEQEYFSDGITEDIITDLSKVSALFVISRNTAFTFKGKAVDVAQVAEELRVSHVLEGSVRKAGNRVRITAQLIKGASDSHVWAERYDRDLSDIFAVQDEISRAIVEALRLKLLPEEKKALEARPTSNPRAYGLHLMARQYNATGNERHQEIVRRLCRRALDLDPNYGLVWAMLSNCLIEMHRRSASDDDGWEAAEQALRLDPNLAEAHAARGAVLCIRGQFEEGLVACKHALELDFDSYEANKHAGRCCIATRRFAEAIRYFEHAATVMPTDFYAVGMALQAYEGLGDKNGAQDAARRTLERVERIIAQEPDHGRAIGFGVYALGALHENERAKDWAERAMLLDPENSNMKYNIACAMAKLGETDMALEILEDAAAVFSPGLVAWIDKDTDFDSIRAHPRFKSIVKRVSARLSFLAPASEHDC
jgi:adenylate cyclase